VKILWQANQFSTSFHTLLDVVLVFLEVSLHIGGGATLDYTHETPEVILRGGV